MSFMTVRTTTAYLAGKRYVEFTVDNKPSGELYLGVDQGVNNYVSPRSIGPGENTLYSDSASYKSDGKIFSRTASLITVIAGLPAEVIEAGDIVSLLVDLDIGEIIFWKNGIPQQTIDYPSGVDTHILTSLGAEGQQVTANLSQDVAFTYTAPVGYTDWAGNAI